VCTHVHFVRVQDCHSAVSSKAFMSMRLILKVILDKNTSSLIRYEFNGVQICCETVLICSVYVSTNFKA